MFRIAHPCDAFGFKCVTFLRSALQGSSVNIVTTLRAGRPVPRPHWLWVPPSLLFYGYQGLFTPVAKLNHSPPSSAEVKNAWSCISTPPIRLHDVVLS